MFLNDVKDIFPNDFLLIKNAYDIVSKIENDDKVYNLDLATSLATRVMQNKLDAVSVVVSLYYPFFIKEKLDENIIGEGEVLSMLSTLRDLEKFNVSTKEGQLSSTKNMFMAMAKDMRVIIIKLFVEVELIHYLDHFSKAEQNSRMIACRELYSPTAAMLGISQAKNEFEEAVFMYFKPNDYAELRTAVNKYISLGQNDLDHAIEKIKKEISIIVPNVKVYGRQKQLASIYKKLQSKNMGINSIIDIYGNNVVDEMMENQSFSDVRIHQIVDILACRILVNTVDECYEALGRVFTLFTPVGNFKDYIANPKENGYQSLHAIVKLPSGYPIEVQIRTFDMHNYAEYGFAAHWAYKEKKKVNDSDVKINYIRQVMDYYKDKSPDELVNILKTDVYSGKIFVQSPMGKILEFPEDATPVDFAYAIHSKIGDKCVGAKINGRMVPLNTPLNNGDTIEIITNVNSKGPSRDWLKFVKCSNTKNRINSFFKKEMKEENIKKGKSILEAQAKAKNVTLSNLLIDEYLDELFERYALQSIDDMYATVGYGGLTSSQILNKLIAIDHEHNADKEIKTYPDKVLKEYHDQGSVVVRGYSNLLTKFAKCCNPLPGDEIIGYISRGKGVTIHRKDCPDVISNTDYDRFIECEWNNSKNSTFVGSILVVCKNTAGVLSNITKKITDSKINIEGIVSRQNPNNTCSLHIQLNVKKKQELDDIIAKLNNFSFVLEIYRI